MRRMAFVMALLLCFACAGAFAEELIKTADINASDAFRRSSTWQNEGDIWSASDDAAMVTLNEIASGSRRAEMSQGFCLLYLSVRGDDALGLTEVLLHACVFRSEPVGGRGIMFSVDGVRYGFQLDAARLAAGAYSYEDYVLPLDDQGLALVNRLAGAGGMVYAYGDGRPYRAALAAEPSLAQFLQKLPDWTQDYNLWAENAAYWPEARPAEEIVELSKPDKEGYVDADFNLLDTRNADAVSALQESLSENGFTSMKKDGKYGSATMMTVKAAQRWYGFAETGLADLRLFNALADGTDAPLKEAREALPETTGLQPTGYRIAREIRARAGLNQTDADHISAASDDLALVTVEGVFTCTSPEAQDVALECEAWLVAGGIYRYPCSVRCESPGSTALGTRALPLQTVKVYWIAEVPEVVIRNGYALELTYTWFSKEHAYTLIN